MVQTVVKSLAYHKIFLHQKFQPQHIWKFINSIFCGGTKRKVKPGSNLLMMNIRDNAFFHFN